MQEIQFISFDNEGKPKTKVFKGKQIEDLLEDPSKPGKIIQELSQEKTQSELDDEALLESHLNKKANIYQEED